MHQVSDAWAILELVGSDGVRDAYRSLLAQMLAVQVFTVDPINDEGLDTMIEAVNARYDDLLKLIRTDLGVSLPLTGST